MKIAIDGTAASGKGTLAKGLAKKLGYDYLDTGLLYRRLALDICKKGLTKFKLITDRLFRMYNNNSLMLNNGKILKIEPA